jgi:general secretion pathway protein E
MATLGGVTKGVVYPLLGQEEKLKKGQYEDSIVALVDDVLYSAIVLHASDIHFQPTENSLIVRYRIDGVLYEQQTLDFVQAPLTLSRLKVLANLDIAERRLPQDGRLRVDMYEPGKKTYTVDFRISTFPTLYGEKMVVRVLDRSLRLLSLESLGLQLDMYNHLRMLINRSHGLFLVTGPTGCGKTTMLYALISALNTKSQNIVTIEDPIEYELAGITQSQVNAKAGFTFENGLRAILRQDPDIIMIGEIRDKVTAHIAIESALTGHLVLSTLHTNDAPSAVARLLEMGIEPFLVSATLIGVLAQRLTRRLCSVCKKECGLPQQIPNDMKDFFDAHQLIYGPRGCRHCHNLGYSGRVGIFELLMVNDGLREHMLNKSDAAQIRAASLSFGMKPLIQDGVEKIKQGITSMEEVLPFMIEEGM